MSRKERYLTYIRKYRECTEGKNMLEASCILEKVVELRFDNTLKQYNGDINRTWDNYTW